MAQRDLAVRESRPEIVIRARSRWLSLGLVDLWRYRDLVRMLAWRDVAVRYKQTVLGVAWALLQPIALMVLFSLVFGRLAQMPSDGVPYPLFAFCGLLPWQLFGSSIVQVGNSLVQNQALLSKVYFPRLAVPVAAVAPPMVDFAAGCVVFAALLAWFGVMPGAAIAWAPLFALLAVVASLALGIWIAAFNVFYRDFRYTLPFLVQLLMFATPVVYPSSLLPEPWRTLFGLNPMAGAIEGFRWAVLGTNAPPWGTIAMSAAATVVLLLGGALYFRQIERRFADVI